MQIKLDLKQFPFLPGSHWVDIFNIFYLEDDTIKYGFGDNFRTLQCGELTSEGFIPEPEKTRVVYMNLLDHLAQIVNELKNLDFGPDKDKIAQIRYVRQKYDLGVKEAKDLVEKGGLPPALKVWALPLGMEFPCSIVKKYTQLAYVEDKGVFPLGLLEQKHLQPILNWQGGLTQEEVFADKYYLHFTGAVEAIAPQASYFYYKDERKFTVEDNTHFSIDEGLLIGVYSSLEEAKSHYAAFKLGVGKASQAYKAKVSKLIEEWKPTF